MPDAGALESASARTRGGVAVALRAVSKRFGATQVLDGIELGIAPGELIVLLGRSGCGKSTLLRIVAGLSEPTSGRVEIGGRDVTGLEPRERDLAMVFQSYALYPHLDVASNIAFPLMIRGVAASERRARVEEVARLLGLEALLDRRPAALSGGQRQRVAIGRALVRRPPLYLFDEPLSNLDAGLRSRMRAELRALHARLGATMLYVTHDQTEAMTLADRIVVLEAGRVQQVAPPEEIYRAPANRFVAEFVGQPPINLIEGEVRGGRFVARAHAAPPLCALPGVPDGACVLGVRPEHVRVEPDDGAGALRAEVTLAEPIGDRTHLHLDLGGLALRATVGGRDAFRYREGDRVALGIDGAVCHRFDPRTGQRVS
ncbi:MAG: ABC transporter ATP-binding protein [Planctomycetota bacterium]|nr:MAG: ABC transporter ATP-binding protein [Planctomycetota bacterium]